MAWMVHGIKELVFVGEIPNDEIDQSESENEDSALENTVNDADDVDEYWLREVEPVLERGWLDELCVISWGLRTVLGYRIQCDRSHLQ
jgi:hypothetical protein